VIHIISDHATPEQMKDMLQMLQTHVKLAVSDLKTNWTASEACASHQAHGTSYVTTSGLAESRLL
jgi:hypothetical protein